MKDKLLTILIVSICAIAGCDKIRQQSDSVKDTATSKIKFSDATKLSGVDFKHFPGYSKEKWMPEVLAAGAAVADFNRDGAPDILLTNSGILGEPRPAEAKNGLFINDGKGKFSNVTNAWGLSGTGYGEGVAVGDVNNDGFIDVFLTNYEGDNRLLKNTGKNFEDITEISGIKPDNKWATSAGMADFDGDGDLDIFVVKYINYTKATHQNTYRNKLQTYSAPYLYQAVSDQIWLNDGNGKFKDHSVEAGITESPKKGLALAIGDIDKDGDQDIYVANDTSPNQLWINDGNGKFKDVAGLAGCAYSEVGKEEGSMGADFSDADGNGRLDITVTNFQEEPTSLYLQIGDLLFRETSDASGIGETSRQRLSFGVDFFDADNDGDEDLLVANGHIEDNIALNSSSISFPQQNSLYENLGDGKFLDVSDITGEALKDEQVSRGLATGDFDSDGDLDFVIGNNGGTAQIGLNVGESNGNFATIWLEGDQSNRSAIGTRVVAKIGTRTIERQVMGAQSYLSVSDFRVHFGLSNAQAIDELTIHWLGGSVQIIKNLAGGKFYYVKQNKEPELYVPGERVFP